MMADEMIGWHHQLDGHNFEKTPGDSEGQGSLVCCSPWGHKRVRHNSGTEQHYLTVSMSQESGYRLAWSPAQDLPRLKSRCHPGLKSHLGPRSSPKVTDHWQNPAPCNYRTEASTT